MKEGTPMPQEHRLVISEPKKIMAPGEMYEYLQKPGNVRWVPAGVLLNEESDECIDGRTEKPVVGNPGGDMAILTEVAIAVANERQQPLEQVEFQKMMEWWLDTFGTFYLHTDGHGIDHLRESVNTDVGIVRLNGSLFETKDEIIDFVHNPDVRAQIRLLNHLLKPENMGCGHLKQMLTDSAAYGVSRKVINGLTQAYFELMWNGTEEQQQKLTYPVLAGEHKEEGVIVVNFPDGVNAETKVPMIRPNDGQHTLFVVHPQVTHFMQEQVANRLVEDEVVGKMNKGMVVNMLSTMQRMHLKETQTTASRLAWGLPMVTFDVK